MLLEYPPGVAAPVQNHPVPGVGYVLQGEVASLWEGGELQTYRVGDSFVESAGGRFADQDRGPWPERTRINGIANTAGLYKLGGDLKEVHDKLFWITAQDLTLPKWGRRVRSEYPFILLF